jgi:Na+/proline symporter
MIGSPVAAAIVLAVLALFAYVGFRVKVAGGDVDDYMLARHSQDAGTLGLSFMVSGAGAWILFAVPEVGAFVGLVGVVGYAIGQAAPFGIFAWLGPKLRAVSPAGRSLTEFVLARFGRAFHSYVVVISVGYMFFFLTAELTAVGGIAAILSGLDPRIPVVLLAIVTLAYTAYGGLRASLKTDRWQAWMLFPLFAVAVVAAATQVDSPGNAFTGSGLIGVDRAGIEVAIALIIAVIVANVFHQGYWQRVWASRDDAALRGGGALGMALTFPVMIVIGVLGILAAGSGMDLGSPPVPFFALLTGLPGWVGAVALVLGVALVASSVDTLENALASLATAERPRTSLGAARVLTGVIMVPAVVVAVQGYSVLRLFLIADLLCATAAVPALLGLWRRATPSGALSGAVAGILGAIVPGWISTGSLADGVVAATFPDNVPTLPPFLWALVASSVVAVVVSLVTSAGRQQLEPASRVNEAGPARG